MKKYNKKSAEEQTPFVTTCQAMHNMMNISRNWLLLAQPHSLQTIYAESGCMRSARLARLAPVTKEVTSQSALQFVVLPASFDAPGVHLYEHRQWSIMLYSWLGEELTQKLYEHLSQRTDCHALRCLLVGATGCELVNGSHDGIRATTADITLNP